MGGWYRRLTPAIAVIVLLLGTGTVAHAVSNENAVLIPGAMPFKQINPFYPVLKRDLYPDIGIHFRGDDDTEIIDYSQDPLASDKAIAQGVQRAIAAVRQIDGKVVVIGESMGSMVAARVAAELADSSEPPLTNDIRVVLMAPPEAGVARYFKEGTVIPILNYRVSRIPESPYPTTIVIGEYDGWSDPPDRPWNLVASLNAVLGALVFVHGQTSLADPADVPAENITTDWNSRGGMVTTYFVPTKNLPLTQVLRLVVPGALVDVLDGFLRPIVDAGYRRHDQPGDPRPYLSDGRIQWNVQGQQAVTPTAEPVTTENADASRVAATETAGESTPPPVEATKSARKATESPAAIAPETEPPVQEGEADAVDPVDAPEADEPEPEPKSGRATEQDATDAAQAEAETDNETETENKTETETETRGGPTDSPSSTADGDAAPDKTAPKQDGASGGDASGATAHRESLSA